MANWQKTIVSVSEMQALRAKVVRGEPLSFEEAMRLIASHEELRGRTLVARERARGLERDNAMLLDTVAKTSSAAAVASAIVTKSATNQSASRRVSARATPTARKPLDDDDD